jgi:hypothetical protein
MAHHILITPGTKLTLASQSLVTQHCRSCAPSFTQPTLPAGKEGTGREPVGGCCYDAMYCAGLKHIADRPRSKILPTSDRLALLQSRYVVPWLISGSTPYADP